MMNSSATELVTIPEFMNLTRLSEADVLHMLENAELSFSSGERGELLIDLSQVSEEILALRKTEAPQQDIPRCALVEEMVASELVERLDDIIDEALKLALGWYSKEEAETNDQ